MSYQPFTGITSIVNTIPSSVIVGASIIGVTPVIATQGGNAGLASRWPIIITDGNQTAKVTASSMLSVTVDNIPNVFISGSVATVGSITALQGTNPWLIGNSSVQTIQGTSPWVVGSVIATIQSSVAVAVTNITSSIISNQGTNPWIVGSVLGTFFEDNPHTSGDAGLFTLMVRNDTLSSITSQDLDYSPHIVGPVGETIVANSPITKWIQGSTSVMYGTSVQAIAPQGSSIFTYITGVQIANPSANNVYVTFTGGLGGISSVLGYTVAPANGGSNIVLPNAWKTGANSGFSASISGVASVYLSAQGFISKT